MRNRTVSLLALLRNTLIDTKGRKIGVVKDVLFTTDGYLSYIVVNAEFLTEDAIYYLIPAESIELLEKSSEWLVFDWTSWKNALANKVDTYLLPDFYSNITVESAYNLVQLVEQHTQRSEGHRTDRNIY